MKQTLLILILLIAALLLITSFTSAETPDECAARLDRTIAVNSYEEAARWWAQVEQECVTESSIASTPEASFVGLFPASGELDFCVMSATLNIRKEPGGPIVDSLSKGDIFTVDLASKIKHQGYVWAEHEKGWSALYPLQQNGNADAPGATSLTHPDSCPSPTATSRTATQRRATPTPSRGGAAGVRYNRDSSYRASIDRLIKGYSETYARSLCGVLDGNRNCSAFQNFAAVTNCVLRTAFFESDDFEEAAEKAETFIGESIPKMLEVANFVLSGGLDKNYANLSPAEKNLVDNLSLMEQCFYEIEA